MTKENLTHETVLLDEAVDALCIKPDGFYIDGTFGRGGHSREILNQLNDDGCLLVIDKDPDAILHANALFSEDKRVLVWQGSFKDFALVLSELNIARSIDGFLLDLGVSSPQIDNANRGFSFMKDGALDMRMNPSLGMSAAEWINEAQEKEIADVLWRLGEERFSRKIARRIVLERSSQRLETTSQLADLIASSIPKREKNKHPATRSFQAIRIHINRELDDVTDCLEQVPDKLSEQGRLVVISFHSLEDRIVKHFMRKNSRLPSIPKGLPILHDDSKPVLKLIGKAHRATDDEVEFNPRSRSAIMRVAEKQQ